MNTQRKYILTLTLVLAVFIGVAQSVSISGPTSATQNQTKTYTVSTSGGSHIESQYSASGGTIISQSLTSVSVKWTSTGTRNISVDAVVGWTDVSSSLNVTVSPACPTLSAGSIGNAQTLCYNGNPSTLTNTASASGSSISYQWQSKSPHWVNWEDISGATGTTYNPPSLTTTKQFRRRAQSCGSQTKYTNVITVTIYSNLNAGSIGNAQTLCYNGNPSTLTNTGSASGSSGGYSYQWQVSSNGSSWSNISGATGTTYNPGALTSSRWYRRRVRANSCPSTYKYTNSVKVTIHSNLNAGSIGNAQTLCYNGNPSPLTNTSPASGSSGGYSYQWQYSTNGSSGWTNISGATGTTYNPGTLTSSRWYRRRVRANSCTSIYKYTNSIKVTIYGNLSPGSINGTQSVCHGNGPGTLGNTGNASGGTSLSYLWEKSTTSATSGFSPVSGATGTSYTPPVLNQTTWYRRRVTSGSGCGNVATGAVKVTYYNDISAGSISGTQSVCHGNAPNTLGNTGNASGGTSLSYLWEKSTTSATSGFSAVSGATGTNYTPPVLNQTTWYRRRVTSGSGCGNEVTGSVKVTYYNDISPGSITGAQSVCHGNAPNTLGNTGNASGGTSLSYLWEKSTTSATSGFSAVSGATGTSYTPPVLNQNTWYRRRVTSGFGCGNEVTSAVKITYYNDITPGSISGAQAVCHGDAPGTLSNTGGASGGTSLSYQWEKSTTSSISGFSSVSGATSTNYSPPVLNQTTWYRRRVNSGSSCGSEVTNAVQVTYYNDLTPGSISGAQSVCWDDVPGQLSSASGASGGTSTTYQWEKSTTSGSTGFTAVGGATAVNYTPPVLNETTWYRRRVNSGSGCGTEVTNSIQVTYYQDLTAGTISGAQTICSNEVLAQLANTTSASGGSGSLTYQWQSSPDNSAWTDIAGEVGIALQPQAVTGDQWYRRRVNDATCSDEAFTSSVKVTVRAAVPSPTINTITYSLDETTIVRDAPPAGETWYWQSTATGQDESDNSLNHSVTNAGSYFLRSKNTDGCWSDATEVVIQAQEPVTVEISPISNEEIQISWSGVSGNETGFKISRASSAAGAYSEIHTAAGTDTVYTDTGLSTGTSYYYRVQAVVGSQVSPGTHIASTTTSPEFNGDVAIVHSPVHNGNISAVRWKGYNDESEQVFTYGYDGLNRLKTAHYAAQAINTYELNRGYYSVPDIDYDLNGNITGLTRQGFNPSNSPDIIDELTYSYSEASGNQLLSVSDTRSAAGFSDGTNTGNDYAYDANGNMVKDLNKGIDTIYYNHLNLPQAVILSDSEGSDSLVYTYDAAGIKLQQKVYEGGTLVKTTDYVGGHIYENDTLQLVQHEEGRIIPKWNTAQTAVDEWDYQYHLKDHLGNTRVTFNTTPENYTITETFETGEDNGFQDLHRLVRDTANTTVGGNEVEVLQSGQTGAMVFIGMNKGDTVNLSVNANYEVAPSGNGLLGAGFAALFTSFDNIYGSGVEGGISSQQSNFEDALTGANMAGKDGSSTAPRAFLNYILFDKNMEYLSAGFVQLTTAAQGIGVHEQLSISNIIADEESYVLAYLSNENQEAVNIHFDDFTVYHGKTNVVQSDDYYPFGLTFNGYQRTASTVNRFLYNQGTGDKTFNTERVTSLGLNWDMTKLRTYDYTIGRFLQVDPLADQVGQELWTPYHYALNNPLLYSDPFGDCTDPDDPNCGQKRSRSEQAQRDFFNALPKAAEEGVKGVAKLSDLNDATVLATTITRGDDAVNIDGSKATTEDKLFAAAGAAVPVLSGSALKFLIRFGDKAESVGKLANDAAKAEEAGFPHGVSTKQVDKLSKSDKAHKTANKSDVEKQFEVKQTGKNPKHHTVILPKPVTKDVADRFNSLFRPPSPFE